MKKTIYSYLIFIFLTNIYAQVDYETEIQTIFNNSCTSCHQYGSQNGLNLTAYAGVMNGGNSGAAVVAGEHTNSLLWQRVENGSMPPTGNLSSNQINLIAQWIDEGALEVPAVDVDTPDVVINEFLAGSDNCCGSEIFDGNNEDFVELYNYGTEPININGWGFSDTDGLITTIAPDTSIAPGDFLVLWYTGDNNGFPEINEKLSKDGETIYIANADGNPMISFDFGPQNDDISYGRNPDGSENWEYFSIPTPGQSNVIENSPPGAFVLTYPENNDTLVIDINNLSDSTMFSWGESVDPDGDTIQYTFQLYGEEEAGSQFYIIYDQVLDNTELSISNNYLSSIVINFYSEANDGYFLQNLSSVPLWWSVFSSDGIDTYGEVSSDELGNHDNGFAITLDLSGIDTTGIDPPEIVVNEFLAGSETCCGADIFSGNTEDFVELYNYGTDSINIYGWGFSDTYGLISTVAPDTNIAPGEFLVLWFTGDNNGFPEINEKLSLEGETIFIANSDGIPIISYDFGPQSDDISHGRFPDGSETWEYFSSPTPGEANIQSLDVKNHNMPESFVVFSAYPNPFNPVTTISYQIPEDGFVNVSIYDMKGRVVKTLVNKIQSKGNHLLEWNASNGQGYSVTSGVYLYMVKFGGFIATRKMILLK